MSRMTVNRAAGTDFVPDMEDWWGEAGEAFPAPGRKKPPLRVYENPAYQRPRPAPGKTRTKRRAQTALNRALLYLTIALLVAGVAMQIARLSQIAAQTKYIASLTSEIKELKSEQANLQVRLSMQQNITRVQDVAKYQLGMDYPDESQIRVVSLGGSGQDIQAVTASEAGQEGDLLQ